MENNIGEFIRAVILLVIGIFVLTNISKVLADPLISSITPIAVLVLIIGTGGILIKIFND